jgi:hypothetical protein
MNSRVKPASMRRVFPRRQRVGGFAPAGAANKKSPASRGCLHSPRYAAFTAGSSSMSLALPVMVITPESIT